MYGLIFNARGVGDAPKKRFIKDKINEFGLDFVCIQETKKSEFEDDWLNNVGGRFCFIWLWEPSRGASGGLLMGVREVNTCTGRFFTKMVLMHKETRFKWVLVNVYGAANSKDKPNFLTELVHILGSSSFPFMLADDFNIIRRASDRNKFKKVSKFTNIFNSIIEHWGLKEIELSGRSFTWSNN
jgi:exonuclease III